MRRWGSTWPWRNKLDKPEREWCKVMRISERQVWLAIAVWLMMAALPVVGQEASPLAVRVTVEAREMPLADLLDEIERQSGC